jgi:ribonuclease BN (tRNA processing enzyme)
VATIREDVDVKVTVIGCSPAWPNAGGAQSGYLVEGAGGRLLLDCGPGVLARLRNGNRGWPDVDAIAITHFHLDHWGDLVPWTFGALYGPGPASGAHPELWLPPGGDGTLRGFGEELGFAGALDGVFDVREYADGVPFRAAGYEVTPLRVPHYDILTFGLRISDGSRTLAYSGDSAPSENLVEVARDAELFLCEATLLAPNPEGGTRGHLAAEEADEAFRRSGAKRLLLTHRPAERPLENGYEQVYDGLELDL